MSLEESTIDTEIKNYFYNYLINELHVEEICYELTKSKRRCVFKIKVNGLFENLVIEYQEDFIGEYSVYFKTTASSDFFIEFLKPLLKTGIIDYNKRFDLMLEKVEQAKDKFKIFKHINMLNNSIISTRSQLDRTYGIHYTVINAPRNISVSINEDLYTHQKKIHYFKTMIYFSFKDNRLTSNCLIFNQSMCNNKADLIELCLVGNDKVFNKNLRQFQKGLEAFAIDELFYPIHRHYGIPFNEIIEMSVEELKTYASVINMLRI